MISQGICSPKQKHTLPRFTTISPKLVKDSLGRKQAFMPPYFFTNTLRNFLVSTLMVYHNPTKTGQGITRPLGIFLRPPHSVPKPSENPKLNPIKEPHHTMTIWKWQVKVETTITLGKTHANDNKRTKNTHACTMHAKNIKEIIHAT